MTIGKPTGYLERQLRRWSGLWEVNATRELNACVERLVGAYLEQRRGDEPLQAFTQRQSDEELTAIATGRELAAVG